MELACSLRVFGNAARLGDSCRKARRAGFFAVELDWPRVCREIPDKSRRVAMVKEALSDHQLSIAGVIAGEVTAERPDQLQLGVRDLTRVFEELKDIGAKTAVITGGPRSLENFNCLRDGLLNFLAPEAERCGLEVALANQVDTRVENRQDLLAVFTTAYPEHIGACIDVYNFHLAAVNAGDAIREMGKRIKLVRMSDLMGTVSVPLGQGEIEIKGLIRALRKVGYDGTIVVDHLSVRDEKIDKALEQACQYLHGIIS